MGEKPKRGEFSQEDTLYSLLNLLQQYSENLLELQRQGFDLRMNTLGGPVRDEQLKVIADAMFNAGKLFNMAVEQLRVFLSVRANAEKELASLKARQKPYEGLLFDRHRW